MVEPQDPLLGNTIAGCRLEKRLAAGGMGVVYRARSHRLDKDVAVKILAASLAVDGDYVQRFFREAVVAETLDHPNIVKVLDSGKDQELYYMVMEYVAGSTLADQLLERGRLSLEAATRITRDISRGLEGAHAAGIIHRDIKPGNILMTHGGTPKITDFGLVRTGTKPSAITLEGVFMGTPEFVSPEQAEGRNVDPRSDLYSLGVCYYQMLSGQYPFFGKTAMEMAMARIQGEPRPIEHALPGVDPRAAAVARKLLRKNPKERYQTATELIADLDAILLGKTPLAAMSSPRASTRYPLIGRETKRTARAVTFSFLLLVSLTCFMVLGAMSSAAARSESSVLRGLTASVRSTGELRLPFLAAGLIALLGGLFVFRRELSQSGRAVRVALILALALACVYAAPLFVEVERKSADPAAILISHLRGLGQAVLHPMHLLGVGVTCALLAVGLAWPRYAGGFRYMAFRLMLWSALALFYAYAVRGDLDRPLRMLPRMLDLLLPLTTATLILCAFGIELGVGFRWNGWARAVGVFLLVVGALGAVGLGLMGSHPLGSPLDWVGLASGLARETAGEFWRRAGPLAVAHFLLASAYLVFWGGRMRGERRMKLNRQPGF